MKQDRNVFVSPNRKVIEIWPAEKPRGRGDEKKQPLGACSRAVVFFNAFFTGAAVMGFEMLTSRFLNPWFGSSIYTWAALIAIALLALCVGYFVGGQIADRTPMLIVLSCINFAAGAFILAVPEFATSICERVSVVIDDVRVGALIASTILMFVPFALLGMYTPFAIRLTLKSRAEAGRTSGWLYGVNTAGCIAGTLGITFFIVPRVGTMVATKAIGCVVVAGALLMALSLLKKDGKK